MTKLYAWDGCTATYSMGQKRPQRCPHGALFGPPPGSGTDLSISGASKNARHRKPLKRGNGLSASPEQRAKVRDLACINCGRDRFEVTITAMHVYPRRFATCSCADGVVPGCVECHDLYDDQLDPKKHLDLLPLLFAHGLRKELVHAVVEHDASILHVLEIVTGVKWGPSSAYVESLAS